jgi:hypothetical protein
VTRHVQHLEREINFREIDRVAARDRAIDTVDSFARRTEYRNPAMRQQLLDATDVIAVVVSE